MDDAVAQFMNITGQSAAVAEGCLAMTEGDVMQAVNMFFESPEIAASFPQNIPAAASSSVPSAAAAAPARPQGTSTNHLGREDSSGVIHIDDDDEGDDVGLIPIADDADDEDPTSESALRRIAQESDDAAMAQRLQQEMYSEGTTATDGVRAPIARTTETLVAPSGYGSAMDDDYGAMHELMRSRARPRPSGNPFGQSIWDDPDNQQPRPFDPAAGASGLENAQQTRAQRLADLFRPPYELMDQVSWEDARSLGKEEKKWILVNVQDMDDFNCQALNRDIWKDEAIAALVKENFIFLQYAKEDPRATEYNTFYFNQSAQENRNNFPHVSIIDPRTGEQVKIWSGIPFPSAQDYHAQLVEFLDRYSLAQNSKNPVSKQKRPQRALDVDRMTEEEMLEMAMRNSLENNGGNGSSSAVNVHDPDELTKSVELDRKGKGKAVATAQDEVMEDVQEAGSAAPPSQSAFASISLGKPHAEPANDPATTTRIQFRHANGRVIRRFDLGDPVRRIYEWLKAEPLEGKDGVEFELKVMPQGKDLLEELDKSIEEAGLKQATVMIEYIEA